MTNTSSTTRFRFWLWLIALVGVIVPRRLRADRGAKVATTWVLDNPVKKI
jgi:hypothetical protein